MSKLKNALPFIFISLLILVAYFLNKHTELIVFFSFLIAGAIVYFLIQQRLLLKRILFLLITYILVIVNYALVYSFLPLSNFIVKSNVEKSNLNLLESFYFSLMTISTMGYTDIYPEHPKVKIIVASEILLGIILLVVGIGYILSGVSQYIEKSKRS